MREWGPHSYEKISILSEYLAVFARAAGRAPNRVYLDAFAGDTTNVLKGTDRQFPGSAQVALELEPPFTHVRLFEFGRQRAAALSLLAANYPGRNVKVVAGDCNQTIAGTLRELPDRAPTFAFLDPDGMELDWSTIRAIADHKRAAVAAGRTTAKVEMWILFSTAGIVRMLGKNQPHAEAAGYPARIARLYGAWGPWQEIWDARLDGRLTPGEAKKAYLYLYMDRLAELGYEHLLVRPIKNTRNELYAMVFATDHFAGRNIMQWAQERPRTRPQPGTLFDIEESRPRYEDLHTGWRDELGFELPPWVEIDWRGGADGGLRN